MTSIKAYWIKFTRDSLGDVNPTEYARSEYAFYAGFHACVMLLGAMSRVALTREQAVDCYTTVARECLHFFKKKSVSAKTARGISREHYLRGAE